MKGKLWVFGDSFTKGGGLTPDSKYYQDTYNGQKMWPELVADKLDLSLVNHGYSWCGSTLIMRNILHYLPEITTNDFVISSTSNARSILLRPRHEYSSLLRTVPIPFSKMDESETPFLDNEEWIVANEYGTKCIDPYLDKFDKFWEDYLDSIHIMLDRLKIRNFKWSSKLWVENKFETITQATDGEVNNIHWSWKGHEQMAEYVLNNILDD